MIQLSLSEQQLFDLIMAVYSAPRAACAEETEEVAARREALLEKLHSAFDNSLTAVLGNRSQLPIRLATRASEEIQG